MMRGIEDRDGFIAHMGRAEIIMSLHYVPLHAAPAGLRCGRSDGALPVTDAVSARFVRLPIYFGLSDAIDCVISVTRNYLRAKPAAASRHI